MRTYGGAYITKNVNPDIDISIRESFYLEGKDEIGMLAADLIEDGDTVILDSSTTALHVAEKIRSRENITVVTNAVKVVTTLSGITGIKIVSTGGTVRPRSLSFIGPEAESTLSRYFADKAFVSCTGADMERDITDTNEQDASMRRLMLMLAAKRILIVDTTKFGKTAFSFISSFMSLTRLLRTRSLRRSGGIISVS